MRKRHNLRANKKVVIGMMENGGELVTRVVATTRKVDLLTLHWFTYDSDDLIRHATKARVPFVLLNHFENRRFSSTRMRNSLAHAAGVGTVSDKGMPDNLRGRYINLSDAVDTEFFAPEKARLGPIP